MELYQTKYTGVLTASKSSSTITYYVSYRKDGKRIRSVWGRRKSINDGILKIAESQI